MRSPWAVTITFEISEAEFTFSDDNNFEFIDTNTPKTYQIDYTLDFASLNQYFSVSNIYYNGNQVGESDVYTSDIYFSNLVEPSPNAALFEQFRADNFDDLAAQNADLIMTRGYEVSRIINHEDTLYAPYIDEPVLQDFNDKTSVALLFNTHDEVFWASENSQKQFGQMYQKYSQLDLSELFDENPYSPYASAEEFVAYAIELMNEQQEFFWNETLFIGDFERDIPSASSFVDFDDYINPKFWQTFGSARIVAVNDPTQVSEPSSLMVLFAGGVLLMMRRIRK